MRSDAERTETLLKLLPRHSAPVAQRAKISERASTNGHVM